jgi:hypothetical protein
MGVTPLAFQVIPCHTSVSDDFQELQPSDEFLGASLMLKAFAKPLLGRVLQYFVP